MFFGTPYLRCSKCEVHRPETEVEQCRVITSTGNGAPIETVSTVCKDTVLCKKMLVRHLLGNLRVLQD